MTQDLLVSVCIPVYNGGLYIGDTLNSLIKQTYKNIEIIVSDNASTDNTGEIVKSFCVADPRVKYFRNKTNLGYCKNILSAVNKASSEFIAIYHADDIYSPNIIEKQYNVLKKNDSIHGVFVKLESFTKDGIEARPKIYNKLLKSNVFNKTFNLIVGNYTDYLPLILTYGNLFACPSFMTRKEIFLELGGFKDTYSSNEDLDLWIRYLQNGYSLAIINEFLFKYRMSENHGSANWRKNTELPIKYKVIDDMIIRISTNLNIKYLKLYKKNKASGYIYAAFVSYLQNNYSNMRENIKKSKEIYLFNVFNQYGIAQVFPKFACYIKKMLLSDKISLKY